MTMTPRDLRKKSAGELKEVLGDLQEQVRTLRFKIASKEVKNHQQMKFVKKDIARILTILKEKSSNA